MKITSKWLEKQNACQDGKDWFVENFKKETTLKNGNKAYTGKCPDCGTELEVVSVKPPKVKEAPKEEEDWGE